MQGIHMATASATAIYNLVDYTIVIIFFCLMHVFL